MCCSNSIIKGCTWSVYSLGQPRASLAVMLFPQAEQRVVPDTVSEVNRWPLLYLASLSLASFSRSFIRSFSLFCIPKEWKKCRITMQIHTNNSSYLTDHYQHVHVDNESSEPSKVKCGIPKRLMLGPLSLTLNLLACLTDRLVCLISFYS